MFSKKKVVRSSTDTTASSSASSSSSSGFFSFEEEEEEEPKKTMVLQEEKEHPQLNENERKNKKNRKKGPKVKPKVYAASKAKPVKSILKHQRKGDASSASAAHPSDSSLDPVALAGGDDRKKMEEKEKTTIIMKKKKKKGGGADGVQKHEQVLQEQQLTKLNTLLNRELSHPPTAGGHNGGGNVNWKVTRLKLAAVRAFQQHIKQDAKKNKAKYSSEEVTKLLGEMQVDLERVLTHTGRNLHLKNQLSGRLSTDTDNGNDTGGDGSSCRTSFSYSSTEGSMRQLQSSEQELTESFDNHEQKLMDALESDSESYLDMKKKWTTSTASSGSHANPSRFKVAVNAVMFANATKRKVRFTTRSVRKFERSSSFWDHEYWDEKEDDTLSSTSLSSSQGTSLLKDSLINEWESRVSLMPSEKDLQRACLKLVVVWVETGHFPSNGKSYKWQRKFGRLSPADLIYHRIHRYPAVALRKLAQLCNRSPNFFLDAEDRQEVALAYLYDALATWENGGNHGKLRGQYQISK